MPTPSEQDWHVHNVRRDLGRSVSGGEGRHRLRLTRRRTLNKPQAPESVYQLLKAQARHHLQPEVFVSQPRKLWWSSRRAVDL